MKKAQPVNKLISGVAGEVTIAFKLKCPCGWASLLLVDEADLAPTECPDCGAELPLEPEQVKAPLECPICGGSRAVLSIGPVYRAQICAGCAQTGRSVHMTARVS